jgi:hypothetical protein
MDQGVLKSTMLFNDESVLILLGRIIEVSKTVLLCLSTKKNQA